MESRIRRFRVLLPASVLAIGAVLALVAPASAVHFYRGPGSGCTAADGELTDDPVNTTGPIGATVLALHNTVNDGSSGLPVTFIDAGQAVRWTWNSSHCHSVQARPLTFYSGFHYPTAEPESPAVLPGLFHYPVPDDTPTLSYVHTFNTPGTFMYACEHHAAIGMVGIVVVE